MKRKGAVTVYCGFCGRGAEERLFETVERGVLACPECQARLASLRSHDIKAAEYFARLLMSEVMLKGAYTVLSRLAAFSNNLYGFYSRLSINPTAREDGERGVRVSFGTLSLTKENVMPPIVFDESPHRFRQF